MYRFLYKYLISHFPDRIVEKLGGVTMAFFSYFTSSPPQIPINILGVDFPSPVGISSGWVDSPQKINTMRRFSAGLIVIKTVTYEPKSGNPYPRIIRGDNYLINSMGLPNKGNAWWTEYNKNKRIRSPIILSVKGENIDEWKSLLRDNSFWVDIFELNFSCPNISSGIMDIDSSILLIQEISTFTDRPIFLKLSPEYKPEENLELVKSVRNHIAGVSLINTIPVVNKKLGNPMKVGGKSGTEVYTTLISHLKEFRNTYPTFDSLPILASGGINPERSIEIITKYKSIPMMLTTFLTHDPYCHSKAIRIISEYLTKNKITLSSLLNRTESQR